MAFTVSVRLFQDRQSNCGSGLSSYDSQLCSAVQWRLGFGDHHHAQGSPPLLLHCCSRSIFARSVRCPLTRSVKVLLHASKVVMGKHSIWKHFSSAFFSSLTRTKTLQGESPVRWFVSPNHLLTSSFRRIPCSLVRFAAESSSKPSAS